jgi:hypothetical protein
LDSSLEGYPILILEYYAIFKVDILTTKHSYDFLFFGNSNKEQWHSKRVANNGDNEEKKLNFKNKKNHFSRW